MNMSSQRDDWVNAPYARVVARELREKADCHERARYERLFWELR
jgi:hypothetical protein